MDFWIHSFSDYFETVVTEIDQARQTLALSGVQPGDLVDLPRIVAALSAVNKRYVVTSKTR